MIPSASGDAYAGRRAWTAAVAALAVLAFLTLAYPVARAFAGYEINFNEGWNAYRQTLAAQGVPLYGSVPRYTVVNYPPVSFHVIGFLGRFLGGVTAAGRYVSLASLGLIAILVAAIVRRFTRGMAAGLYAALSFIVWLAVFSPDRIGMNDPQLFATVFGLAGFYAFLTNPESPRILSLSAVLFALCLFTKHNLFAIPLAVGAYLLLGRAWRPFLIWAGACLAASLALFLAARAVDGPYLLVHMASARTYSIRAAVLRSAAYVGMFQIPVAVLVLWCWRNAASAPRRVLVLGAAAAHATAFILSGGHGVDRNIFFDAMLLDAVILAVALADYEKSPSGIFAVLLLAPLIAPAALAPPVLAGEAAESAAAPRLEQEFQETIEFVADHAGRAFCANPLVCFAAGKPDEIDMFYVPEQIALGKLPESELVNMIETYRFSTIEIGLPGGELVRPDNFSINLMHAIERRYRIALRNTRYAILVPKLD